MRLLGYIRVSSAEQARDGHSLDAQRRQLQAYCDLYGYELVDVISEPGRSAFKTSLGRRAAGRELLARIRRGEADGFAVTRLDRAFRRLADAEDLLPSLRSGDISLHSVADRVDTSTAAGRLALRMLVAMSEYESDVKSERNRSVSDHLRDTGRSYGPTPYGLTDIDGQLYRHPDTWAARQWIVQQRADGLSFRALARACQARGMTPPRGRGRRWSDRTIKNICDTHHSLDHIPAAPEREGAAGD